MLLLDEPLGALDLKLRKEMQLELKALQREVGITFVYVTHDQEEALTMCDVIVVMRDGRIQQMGGPTELYERPDQPVRRRLHRHLQPDRRAGSSRSTRRLARRGVETERGLDASRGLRDGSGGDGPRRATR